MSCSLFRVLRSPAVVAAALVTGLFLSPRVDALAVPGPESSAESREVNGTPIVINLGLSGSWYDPASPGRGFFIDVLPQRKEIVVVWVTFDGEAPRWYSALGPFEGASAALNIYETQVRGSITETVAVGSARLDFKSCTSARLTHDLEIGEPREIPLARLTPDVQCQLLQFQPFIPNVFQLKGTAYAFDKQGNSVQCELDLSYEIRGASAKNGGATYSAILSGQVRRIVTDSKGHGPIFEFQVSLAGVRIEWIPPSTIRVRGPGKPVDEQPFFRGLSLFRGVSQSGGRAVGGWSCAPFISNEGSEHPGSDITAEGTWYIHPAGRREWGLTQNP